MPKNSQAMGELVLKLRLRTGRRSVDVRRPNDLKHIVGTHSGWMTMAESFSLIMGDDDDCLTYRGRLKCIKYNFCVETMRLASIVPPFLSGKKYTLRSFLAVFFYICLILSFSKWKPEYMTRESYITLRYECHGVKFFLLCTCCKIYYFMSPDQIAESKHAKMQLHIIQTNDKSGPLLLQMLWGKILTGVIYRKNVVRWVMSSIYGKIITR